MNIATGQNGEAGDFVGNPAPYLSFETSASATHSLTTVADERVTVWASGSMGGSGDEQTVSLKYNGVTKHSMVIDAGASDNLAFSLMYSEIPGSGTHDITVEIASGGAPGSLSDVKIVVCKLLVG